MSGTAGRRADGGLRGAVPAGLCERCQHVRRIASDKGSTFYLCGRAEREPGYRKYPALPVLRCPGFTATDAPAR